VETQLDIELLVDLDSPVCCEAKDCGNEAKWVRRHDKCSRLECSNCKEYAQSQFLLLEDDESLWCSVCDYVELLDYWMENMKWLTL
jgi:hypothetical protein